MVNTTLTKLDIGGMQEQHNTEKNKKKNHDINNKHEAGNDITEEGARVLSEALKVNTTLTKLNFGSMQQERDDAKQEQRVNQIEQNRERSP